MRYMKKHKERQTDNNAHICGYVAIIGMPNAGKSTLMNRYLHEKVSIVSPKPQTTRANVTTILSSEQYQIIFIDTPGILRPRYKMQEVMTSLVKKAISEADVVLLMIDASQFQNTLHPGILKLAGELKKRNILVAINKIDLVQKPKLLNMMKTIAEHFPDAEQVPISALTSENTDELFTCLLDMLPEGQKMYPDDIISTEPERFFVAEIIREAIFLSMEDEIPYASGVVIEAFKEKEKKTVIHASILVEKKSQKPIIIGKSGQMIKNIGIMSRRSIEEFLGRPVYLDLHVKIRNDWRNKDAFLREIGLKR